VFVSRFKPIMFLGHIYKSYLNVLIELRPNPGLNLSLNRLRNKIHIHKFLEMLL